MAPKSAYINLVLVGSSLALVSPDGHTGRLPALGWNSWNEYECAINESIFLEVGNLFVSLGLKDLGYTYVNIDDCWSDKVNQRDSTTGQIRPDEKKFPQGIKHTADEIHKLGLKLGIYSDAGTKTCGGYAGSLGHEELDANTFAEWGIIIVPLESNLKYDNCNVPSEWQDPYQWVPENWFGGPPAEKQSSPAPAGYDWKTSKTFTRYKSMSDALLNTKRSIQFSECVWGHAHVDEWGSETGHSWRMWGDIFPRWQGQYGNVWGIMPILNHASFFYNTTNFWGHGDWDMLEVGNGDLTVQESRSHFALWAALKSPLIIGTPLHNIKPEILKIFLTKELIDFNQDSTVGAPAKPYKWGVNPNFTWNQTHPAEYWNGQSSKGVHVFVLNTLSTAQSKTVDFSEVPGLDAGAEYTIVDLWSGEEQGRFKGKYEKVVDSHDTLAIRMVKAN